MKILYTILLTITVVNTVCAKEVFTNKDLKEIEIIEIRDGKAIVHDSGRKEEVEIGDSIGKDKGKVVEIGKGAVIVEHGNTRIRIRQFPGLVQEENVSR